MAEPGELSQEAGASGDAGADASVQGKRARASSHFYWFALLSLASSEPAFANEWILPAIAAGAMIVTWILAGATLARAKGEPSAWLERTARLAAVLALVAGIGRILHMHGWWRLWPSSLPILPAAILGCILANVAYVSRVARGLGMVRIAGALMVCGFIVVGARLVLLKLGGTEVAPRWEDAYWLGMWALRRIHVLGWLALLLLVGRVVERIRSTPQAEEAPAPKAPATDDTLVPKSLLAVGVVLMSLAYMVAFSSGSRWGLPRFFPFVFLGAYLLGLWLVSGKNPMLIDRKQTQRALGIRIAAGGLLAGIVLIYWWPDWRSEFLMGAVSVLSIVSLIACFWLSFSRLSDFAIAGGQTALAGVIELQWVLLAFGTVLRVVSLMLPYQIESYVWRVAVVDIAEMLLAAFLLESVIVLGRMWQWVQSRPDLTSAPTESPGEPEQLVQV